MTVRHCIVFAFSVVVTLGSNPAWAGPPFRTDDPEPVEYRHWELNGFSQATRKHGDTAGVIPGFEVNYGAAANLQLHALMPLAFDKAGADGMKSGMGDAEFGFKYRFVNESDDGWWPEIAVFPAVDVPTGNQSRGLGTGHSHEFLPIWFQKTFGIWTTDAGGGYWNNPGLGLQNYWFAGWLLQRKMGDDFALGGEIFHQTADVKEGKNSTGFNVGGTYDFSDNYHLLLSVGRGIQNVSHTNEFSYYAALQWTFGPQE